MSTADTFGAAASGGVRLLSDAPLDDAALDYFGFSDFARALAEILDNERTATPLTVAVSAPWGAGKTSVARMVQRLLEDWVAQRDGDRPRVVCWFNAWDHDDAPHLGAALAAVVARDAARRRPWWRRIFSPLPAAMLGPQERWRRVAGAAAVSLAAATALALTAPTQQLAATVAGVRSSELPGLGWFGVVALVWLLWRRLFAAATDAARFVDDPRSAAARGSMAQVSEQLGRLVRQGRRGGRMIIVVDDLERCRPARALEVFQVASQLLGHDGVATVLLADMRTIERAAESAYSGAEAAGDKRGLGRRYMEKLLQLEVVLPPPRPVDMRRLLSGEPPQGAARTPAKRTPSPGVAAAPTLAERAVARLERAGKKTFWTAFFVLAAIVSLLPETEAIETAAGALVWFLIGVILWAQRRRRRRREREQVERTVEAAIADAGDAGSHEIKQTAVAAASDELKGYALKTVESLLTVHGPEVAEVEDFICRHPPPLPRAAKRMLNHARLLTRIASDRRMFGGDPELTPAHLGEWIVMGERWPQLVERVAAQPAEMARLEQLVADGGDLAAELGSHLPGELGDLEALLRAEPTLAPVVERLIRFEPAPWGQATPGPALPVS
jgi:hypothetical protein